MTVEAGPEGTTTTVEVRSTRVEQRSLTVGRGIGDDAGQRRPRRCAAQVLGRLPWFAPLLLAVATLAGALGHGCLLRSAMHPWDGPILPRGWMAPSRDREAAPGVHPERAARRAHRAVAATRSSTCSGWSPSGSCWPTCRSPTSCCGFRWPGTRPAGGTEFLCVAQARPTTAPTAHPEDMVAARVGAAENPQLRRAVVEGRICREEDPRWHLEVPVRRETIPVRHGRTVIAVLSRDTNLAMPRVPSPLEIAYLGSASDLCQMVADGTFPPDRRGGRRRHQPAGGRRADPAGRARPRRLRQPERAVGLPPDGPRAATSSGVVARATPRGSWCTTRSTRPRWPPGSRARWTGKHSLRMEVRARGAVMLVRALPLRPRGDAAGALVLVRDVTDLRRRDMALLSQGRDDPGDPPPGEEQPADRGGAAAPAGPPHGHPGGRPGARRERAAGELDRAGARDAVGLGGRAGGPRRAGRQGAAGDR